MALVGKAGRYYNRAMRLYGPVFLSLALINAAGCGAPGDKPADSRGGSLVASEPPKAESLGVSADASSALEEKPNSAAAQAVHAAAVSGDDSDPGRVVFDGEKRGAFLPHPALVYAGSPEGFRGKSSYALNSASSREKGLKISEPPVSPADSPKGASGGSQGGHWLLNAFKAFQEKMYVTIAPVLSRFDWGASPRKGQAVSQEPCWITIHHTGGPAAEGLESTKNAVRGFQRYHMYGRADEGKKPFEDIGYHYLIGSAGIIALGRPENKVGAHVKDKNPGRVGIALIGNYDEEEPTPEQIKSLVRLGAYLAIKYGMNPGAEGFIEPHKHFQNTDCPGKNIMAILPQIRQDIIREKNTLAGKMRKQDGSKVAGKSGDFIPALAASL